MNIKGIFIQNNTLNVFVVHCNVFDHNFDIKNAVKIKRSNLLKQKCVESSLILESCTVNTYMHAYVSSIISLYPHKIT